VKCSLPAILTALGFLLGVPGLSLGAIQTHATDCTALTCSANEDGEACLEADTDDLYVCDGDDAAWKHVGSVDLRLAGSETEFPLLNGSPNVEGGSFFKTNSGAGSNIDDFGWGCVDEFDDCSLGCPGVQDQCNPGPAPCSDNLCDSDDSISATPDEVGQIIYVRTVGSTTYHCFSSSLICGSDDIGTSNGDSTLWISTGTGGSSVNWRLLGFVDTDQSFATPHLQEEFPRAIGTFFGDDVQLGGFLDLGFVEYFTKDDTTPSVALGTLFYSWDCTDNYNTHCVDDYSLRAEGPCSGNIQCSGAPDTFCDYDGLSLETDAPQRVDDGGGPDNLCDSDGITASPAGAPGGVLISDFDDGVDGQIIYVVTQEQSVTYDCTGAQLICGNFDIVTSQDDSTAWFFNALDDKWQLIAFEDNTNDSVKAGRAADNTFTGDNTFDGALDLGSTDTFGAADTTPSVAGGVYFETAGTPTITDFDDPTDGQIIYVLSATAVTYDCTGAGLVCGAVDIVTASGDATSWFYDGADWRLVGFHDQSVTYTQFADLGANTFTGDQCDGSLPGGACDGEWIISSIGRATFEGFLAADVFQLFTGSNAFMTFGSGTTPTNYSFLDADGDMSLDGGFGAEERAANAGGPAGWGHYWVKTATPNRPYFTDDAGTEFLLDELGTSLTSTTNDLVSSSGGLNIASSKHQQRDRHLLFDGGKSAGYRVCGRLQQLDQGQA
jgi:hypothetical protein